MIKLLTTQEVANRLGIGDRRVRKMINAGNPFPTVVIQEGRKRKLGVRPEVLENYIKSNQSK